MPFFQKLITFFPQKGGLVSDVDPKNITGGGLHTTIPETGALNVRAVGDDTNLSPQYEPIRGDLFINGFAEPGVQNRIFRIYITSALAGFWTLRFRDANGTLITTTGVQAITPGNLAATYATLINSTPASGGIGDVLTAAGETFIIGGLVTTAANEGNFTIEITTIPGWDYDVYYLSGTIETVTEIIQEGVDPSMLGFWRHLGSDWKQGDLWQFWTTRFGLPATQDILTVTDNGAGLYLITTTLPHNLAQNQAVEISLTGVPSADGIWIVNVTGSTTAELLGSTWVANSATGILTTNIYGYGQITVSVKDENNQTWTGTVLLRSKEFNFSTLKQIDCRVKKKQDLNIALYFTDNYNPYRVFYYKGAYITDGGLTINGGQYDYGIIGEELVLDLFANGFLMNFVNQTQFGGNVRSGNWRYAVRFGTDIYSFTTWSFLSNPVSVATATENGAGSLFFGDPSGTATGKQNVLGITNIIPGLFTYVEIAAVNYLDGGFTGEIIGRYILTGATTQQIIHTGFELNVTDLDIGTLNQLLVTVRFGRNIELLNNRLVKSNLTLNPTVDLSAFFESFTYSINRIALNATIPGVGSFISNNLRTGEYMFSGNVYTRASLMLNERYRFGFIAELTNGGFSSVFWSRDIVINTTAQTGSTAVLPDFNLTTGGIGNQHPYSFYITWSGYNPNMLIDGKPVRDIVKRVYCMRCEVVNPQILASGVIIAAVSGSAGNTGGATPDYYTYVDPANTAVENQYGEFPFPAGINEPFNLLSIPVNYAYNIGGAVTDFAWEHNYCSFYSPDISLGRTSIAPQNGIDRILNFGQPTLIRAAYPVNVFPNPDWDNDYFLETNGEMFTPPASILIAEGAFVAKGASATLNGNLYSKKGLAAITVTANGKETFDSPDGLVLYSAATFLPLTANPDYPVYNAQYLRAIANGDTQYGLKKDSKYVWTGAVLEITDNTPTTFAVFGGDVFTQKSYLKNRYGSITDTAMSLLGFGQGISYYSQNRANFQMRNENAGSTTPNTFPNLTVQAWLNDYNLESLSYNEGYTIRNQIQYYNAFDSLAQYQTDWGNVEWWSQAEAEGAVTDRLRVFLPLDIHFEDYTYGYITEFKNENEEAVVVQQRKTTRAYFNSAAILSTVEGSEVITGDGGIMNQKGLTVSKFGSSNKWSIQQGKNQRGNDVLYGIDTDMKNIWRYGYDGEDNLSEMQLIASFAKNNMQFVIGKDTPAHLEGICSFANQKFREVGWTFRGWKSGVQEWTEPEFHVEHDFVNNVTGNQPVSDLLNINGVLYGTTMFGGTAGLGGVLFSYDSATDTFTNLHNFIFGAPNSYYPESGLTLATTGVNAGKLYGTTRAGGVSNIGSIYEWNIGTATFTKMIDFVAATGSLPLGEMVEYNGKMYGMCSGGGLNGGGVIFEYDYNTNVYTDIFDFSAVNGTAPQGKLLLLGTIFYGLTSAGGVNGDGVLFSYDLTTYTLLHEFDSAVTGAFPVQSLCYSTTDNILYGCTQFGGTFNLGTIFGFSLNTLTLTSEYSFSLPFGSEPICTPILIGDYLYGTTRLGGAAGFGALWRYNIVTDVYTKLYDFDTPTGSIPNGQMVLINNTLYGLAQQGGTTNNGVIYSFDLIGIYDIGDVVQSGLTSFEQVPAFYSSLVDGNISIPPGTDPTAWELLPTTNNRYYTFYTLIYSELKDVFQLFHSPKPNVYWQYKNGYGTCRPVGDTGTNYEADYGTLLTWWDDGSTALVAPAYFDGVANVPQNIRKTFVALEYVSEIAPDRVEVTTKEQQTYIDSADMETRETTTDMAIPNDSSITTVGLNGAEPNPTGINSLDTSKLMGYFAVVRTVMTQYNRISSFIMKIRFRARIPNK